MRKMYFKKAKCCLAVWGEEKCERSNPEGRAEEAGGGAECLGRHSPAASGEDHSGAGVSLVSTERSVLGLAPTCSIWRTPCHSPWMFPEGTVIHGELTLYGVEYPKRATYWTWCILKDCSPWEGPHSAAGRWCEEDGVAERKTYRLTAALMPCPPVLLGVEGKEGNSEMNEKS